ncbi:MAG: transporter, partial [Burkholderiales bacterium]
INVPINQNPDFGIGPDHGWRYTLTLQPVIPIHLSNDWNIISRTVVPAIYQDSGGGSDFGLGDIAQSFFLSHTHPTDEGWFWGAGPIFVLPTATNARFGAEQWAMGPTVGLLKRSGPWTIGALTNHTWSLSGHEGRSNVNATFLQPFIDYTFESRTTLSLNTESTYDWTQRQWIVPVHFVVRQLFDIGGQQVSVGLGARYYAETPAGGPQWGLRLGVTFVFPK